MLRIHGVVEQPHLLRFGGRKEVARRGELEKLFLSELVGLPDKIRDVSDISRTSTGKLDKKTLRKQYVKADAE